MRVTNSTLILMLGAMAVANRLGYPGEVKPVAEEDNWFVDYLDDKDRVDLDEEGKALDLSVDDAGMF
jgi:hypothetical protein